MIECFFCWASAWSCFCFSLDCSLGSWVGFLFVFPFPCLVLFFDCGACVGRSEGGFCVLKVFNGVIVLAPQRVTDL